MSGNNFFAFWDGNGKTKKAFPVFGTGTGYKRNHSHSSGRERDNQNFIPVKRDGNGKFESALKAYFCLQKCSYLHKLSIFKASALWADAFYKSICPYVCVSVCVFVHF